MDNILAFGGDIMTNFGLPTVCAWFMFRLEKILTKLTDTVSKCPHRIE